MKSRWSNLILAVLSGILGALAFPPFGWAPLAWLAFVPFFLLVRNTGDKGSFWYPYLSGVIFFGALLYWMVNVTVPGTVILVLYLAVFYGIFGIFTRCVFKYSIGSFLLPFMWVILEYLRGNVFTGFPWGLLGYTQYENIGFIQIADITGVYGVSFIIMFFNVAAANYVSRTKGRIPHMAVALFLIIIALIYSKYTLDSSWLQGSAKIAVVQGNIPQGLKWDAGYADKIIEEYSKLTKEVSAGKPDMIIWPETAYPYTVTSLDKALDIASLVSETGIPVLAGAVYQEGTDYFNSALLFLPDNRDPMRYDKNHLVPFGEYIPLERYFPTVRDHVNKPIGDFTRGKGCIVFPLRSTESVSTPDGTIARTTNFYKFGVLICFEDIFPYIAREAVLAGANLLVNITNDAWFGDTSAPRQHLQASVFRAVENRVSLIRAANTGISCFVDYTGEVILRIADNGKDTFVQGAETGYLRVCGTRSYYTANGDIFIFLCGLTVIMIFATNFFLSQKTKKGENNVS